MFIYLILKKHATLPSTFHFNDDVFQVNTINESWSKVNGGVKTGDKCINKKEEKLCYLQVIENSAQARLAVLFSLSHILGDGHTCYNIWKMLDMNETVKKFEVERNLHFEDSLKNETSLAPLTDVSFFGEMWSCLKRGVGHKFRGTPPPVTYAYKLNEDAIAARKALYNTGGSFVSMHKTLSIV